MRILEAIDPRKSRVRIGIGIDAGIFGNIQITVSPLSRPWWQKRQIMLFPHRWDIGPIQKLVEAAPRVLRRIDEVGLVGEFHGFPNITVGASLIGMRIVTGDADERRIAPHDGSCGVP